MLLSLTWPLFDTRSKEMCNPFSQLLGLFKRALPNRQNAKAVSAKLSSYFFVALSIPSDFGCPESQIDLWQRATVAVMTVPKATMNKDAPLLA